MFNVLVHPLVLVYVLVLVLVLFLALVLVLVTLLVLVLGPCPCSRPIPIFSPGQQFDLYSTNKSLSSITAFFCYLSDCCMLKLTIISW